MASQTARIMVKDEDVCHDSRPLRRTLPHRRLGHASLLVQRHQSQ